MVTSLNDVKSFGLLANADWPQHRPSGAFKFRGSYSLAETSQRLHFIIYSLQTQRRAATNKEADVQSRKQASGKGAVWFLALTPSGSHPHSCQFRKKLHPCSKSTSFVKACLDSFQLFKMGNTRCAPWNHKTNQNCAVKRTHRLLDLEDPTQAP